MSRNVGNLGVFFNFIGKEIEVKNTELDDDVGIVSYWSVRAYRRLGSERCVVGEMRTFVKPSEDAIALVIKIFNAYYAEVIEVYEITECEYGK